MTSTVVLAIEGNFAYSFMLGILAAVNPCGFVLLPAYLLLNYLLFLLLIYYQNEYLYNINLCLLVIHCMQILSIENNTHGFY